MLAVYGPVLSYRFLGAFHTYLKVACFSTDKESLALRNDWLSIDLTWEDVAQSVARQITVGS